MRQVPRARQQGAPGQAYANRTDLNAASTPQTVPGQEYGQQTAQMNGMVKSPVAQEGAAVVTPAGAQPQPQTQAPAPAPVAPGIKPGSLPFLDHPTERPNEGLLPENDGVMQMQQAGQQRHAGVAALFHELASAPGAPPELQTLSLLARKMTPNG